MLGINDPLIWLAYVMCLLAAAFSVGYGLVRRNRGGDEITPEDRAWARKEKKVEDEI
jgi:hypothetical protein